jgi:hypothetical protein
MKRSVKVLAATATALGAATCFAVAASTPTVVTGSPTGVNDSGAVVHGTVNPDGSSTSYYFQWGLSDTYGVNGVMHSAGAGTKALSVASPADGLTPGTVYHYRIVATNLYGTALGRDRTFTTTGHPPAVVTTGPTYGVGHAWAIVTGTVNPEGEATGWAFQYGTTSSYGLQTFASTLPASSSPQGVHSGINGLSDGTTFHYRLIGIHNNTIVSYGSDLTFTTLPFPRPLPGVRAATIPHRAHTKPYLFTTSGSITLPASIPASVGCNGTVSVRFFLGRHSRAKSLAPVQSNCTFSVATLFHRLIGKHSTRLRIEVRFHGNPYLAPASARPQRVHLG